MRRKSFPFLIAFTILLFCLYSAASAQDSTPPDGWKQVAACDFSFLVPRTVKKGRARPFDSCVASFSNKDLHISLDYGWYSEPGDPDPSLRDYKESQVTIGGRTARLITYSRQDPTKFGKAVTMIHIVTETPKEGESGLRTALLMTLVTTDSVDPGIVQRIYESIRYTG